MAERTPPPLSPAARDLLRAFRDDESPTEHDRRRGLDAVRARLPESSAAANGSFYAKVVFATMGVAAAMLLGVKMVGAGVTALANDARQPAMEAPYQGEGPTSGGQASSRAPQAVPARRSPGTATSERAAVIVEEAGVQPPSPSSTAPAVRPRPSNSSRTPATSAPSAEDLVLEVELFKQAQQAKQQGRHAEGLATLAEHARRFPQGTLADERMVLEAELLCASGKITAARAKVDRFLSKRSGSALAGRMRVVCSEPSQ